MKSLISVCLLAGSALIAGNKFTGSFHAAIPAGASFFTCDVDGTTFTATDKATTNAALATTFTYTDAKHIIPAAVFINAEQQQDKHTASFYIQPVNDDAPAAALTAHSNLYQQFFVTYKAANGSAYNTTTAPGNFEITSIDTTHKLINGKLNCMLYSSANEEWILVTNGRFRFKF